MKTIEKDKAIELRKQGRTFGEILREVSVSKGSLSYWLRDIDLTREQIARIQYKNDAVKQKFIRFNQLRKDRSERNKRFITADAVKEINKFSLRELKLVGIALYWAEGYKERACRGVEFTNTDPGMIRLMMQWFREVCSVRENQFRIRLQVHNGKGIEKITSYWADITGVALSQFTKPYVKTSPSSQKKMGNLTPYGTCNIRISDIRLITKIKGWIKGFTALSSSPV